MRKSVAEVRVLYLEAVMDSTVLTEAFGGGVLA